MDQLWISIRSQDWQGFIANVDKFRFVGGQTPLSSETLHFGIIVGFLASVWLGKKYMENRKPFKLTILFFLHNVILCLFSLALFLALGYQIYILGLPNGLFWLLCSPGTKEIGALHLIYYINYLGKLYELLDTHFLVLKGKPLEFLQVYHHAATFFLTWVQMVHWSSVQWVPIFANLGVHVIMYAYFALTTLGFRPPWKIWVTIIQIVQFVIDIVFIAYASYMHAIMDSCQGDMVAVWSGVFIISSYFILFVQLFFKLYVSKKGTKKAEKKTE